MSKIKIALLSGGNSSERNISLKTGNYVYDALDKEKYEIFRYDPKTDLIKFFIDASTKKFDITMPLLHGAYGEDGRLQGMLDMIEMPYLFSGVLSSALAMDKHKCKMLMKDKSFAIAKDIILKKNSKYEIRDLINELSLPIVIKPAESESSIGINVAHSAEELKKFIAQAFQHNDNVLLEEFIRGREFTIVVTGNKLPEVFPIIEIIPDSEKWFDNKAKYELGGAQEICPAIIPDDVRKELEMSAIQIYQQLNCKDLSRIDFIWSSDNGMIYFLELNSIPGLSELSLVPKAVQAEGMQFSDFLDNLINNSLSYYGVDINKAAENE
jgi:D-alanine-D-alanine ligase